MAKNKSTYRGYTEKEVFQIESSSTCLVMGGDFIQEGGIYLFTKKESEKLYNKYLKNLIGIVRDGSEKDRAYALDLILGLAILPMRFH